MSPRAGSRSGYTLIELVIALVVVAVIGVGLTRLLLVQGRFYDRERARREARAVGRGALNLLQSDLRMLEAGGGLVSADSASIVIRVPYAFGVVGGASGGATTVSLLPVDSLMYAGAAFSGYAWRDSATGAYTYAEAGTALGAGVASILTGLSITTLTGGKVIGLSPALPGAATAGTPVFLFQKIRYEFAPSTAMPGRTALWRTTLTGGAAEEILAPFDRGTRFKFYALDADTSQNAAPAPLSATRGIELVLNVTSEKAPAGRASPERAVLNTAVFFRNRAN